MQAQTMKMRTEIAHGMSSWRTQVNYFWKNMFYNLPNLLFINSGLRTKK